MGVVVMGFFSGMELEQVKPKLSLAPLCGVCQLYRNCQTPKMPVSGGGRLKVMLVGDAPNEAEDGAGKHAVGKGYRLLRETLAELDGVEDIQADFWYTHALICHPGKARPTGKQIDYCRPNLLNAIKELKPHVVIPMGMQATKSIVDYCYKDGAVDSIKTWAGWQIPDQKLNVWICPTFHPTVDFNKWKDRDGNDDPILTMYFKEHIKQAVKKAKSRPWQTVPSFAKEVKILETFKEIKEAIDYFIEDCQDGLAAFDYETTMLKPDIEASRVRCVSLSDDKETVAFLFDKHTRKEFKRFLLSPTWKIASNLKFEMRWSERIFGVWPKNWLFDTMVAAHVLDNRSDICSIKFQGYVRYGQSDYGQHIERYIKSKQEGGYAKNEVYRADVRDLLIYCGLDSLLEVKVARDQMREFNFFHKESQ